MTREEAINAITAFVENYASGNDLVGLKMAIEALKEERQHREWTKRSDGSYKCPFCCYSDRSTSNFCPNCGATFEGSDFNDQIGRE